MKGGWRVREMSDIYEEYSAMVRAFLLRMCHNDALADELTQETFYRAVKEWPRFRGDSSVTTWLCTIAKHLYWDALRKKTPLSLETAPQPATPDFTEALAQRDRAMVAQRLLHGLAEPYREVFTLRTFCDLSHAQIAGLFGKSDAWARVTYYRARTMLADMMKEAETDED